MTTTKSSTETKLRRLQNILTVAVILMQIYLLYEFKKQPKTECHDVPIATPGIYEACSESPHLIMTLKKGME